MIQLTVPYSSAASTTTPNLLSGTSLAFLGKASQLTIWAACFLTAAHDSFSLQYAVGGQVGVLVPAGSTVNNNPSGPQQLNDLVGAFGVPANAALTLALVTDATAGTHTGAFKFLVEP